MIRYRDRVRTFEYPLEPRTLGSAPDNDWVCGYPGISRQHASVRPHEDGLVVTDCGSKNGLRQDGIARQEVVLRTGEAVRLGRAVLTLEEVSTDDFETGLEVERAPSSHGEAGDTESDEETFDSPAAALHLVRTLERLAPWALAEDQRLADRVRVALGARSLVVLRGGAEGESDTVVCRCSGPLPDADWDELGLCGTEDLTLASLELVAGPTVACWRGASASGVAAVFARPAEAWQRDFVSYLADRIGTEEGSARAGGPAASGQRKLDVPEGIVLGSSRTVEVLLTQMERAVSSGLDVLLLGETGVGKEVFAKMIHASSKTAEGPFIPVNCPAIPADLLESLLFGVESGVATGVEKREGLFVEAGEGTLMLDEVGELALPLQAKLLRVLQEREVFPVGGSRPRKVAARVISASNRDLRELVGEGKFRADLYYRLRRLEFTIPPLRERAEDIPALVLEFTRRAARRYEKRIAGVSRRALQMLREYPWPGNIRELETAVEKAVLACPSGGSLESRHFPELLATPVAPIPPKAEIMAAQRVPAPSPAEQEFATLAQRLDRVEREAVAEALDRAGGNKTKAAKLLGITRQGLNLKLRRWREAESMRGPEASTSEDRSTVSKPQ